LAGLFHAQTLKSSQWPRAEITDLPQGLGAIFISGSQVIRTWLQYLEEKIMKASFINPRNVALLVAAGLIASTGTAMAVETTASPTATAKPLTQYQQDRAAFKTALDAYVANRQSSQAQYKAALDAYNAARKSYATAQEPILATYKADLAAAKAVRDAAIAAATTPEAKLAANTAHKAAIAAATAKRDAAKAALGAAPVAPTKPVAGTKPVAPAKPTKAPKATKTK
jgi:hypothetical protein